MLRYSFGNINGKAYGLNANELSVYEAIGKCSRKDDARGWYADLQTLADQLPHRIGRMTVSRAVDKLLTLGLIRRDGNSLFVCAQNEHERAQIEHADAQNEHANAQNEQNSTPPYTPPINNKNEMEKENTRTCVPTHDTANPETSIIVPEFYDLTSEYQQKGGEHIIKGIVLDAAQEAWRRSSPAKKIKLLEAVSSGAHFKPRLDWLISDFPEPSPTNWSGTEQGGKMLADHTAAIAQYNGRYGVYTFADITLFNLKRAYT